MNNTTTDDDCVVIKLLRSEYRFAKMLAREWGFADESAQVAVAAVKHKAAHHE